MPTGRLWVQSSKPDAQRVRTQLEAAALLARDEKVRAGPLEGSVIVPTTASHDRGSGGLELPSLGDLGIDTMSLSLIGAARVLALPSHADHDSHLGPVQDAVAAWLASLPGCCVLEESGATLLALAPKRWSVYAPMLLFPAAAFQDPAWATLLRRVGLRRRDALWRSVLQAVRARNGGGGSELTHLAVNARIPLCEEPLSSRRDGRGGDDDGAGVEARQSMAGDENVLRSPSGLVLLFGDFGPEGQLTGGGGKGEGDETKEPTTADFESAFWVGTRQNGIWQTWAPRHTMFSRGNVKEKARILGFRCSGSPPEERGGSSTAAPVSQVADRPAPSVLGSVAVDLYAGIGYFVFSYAKLGISRVLGWEINPWSVEGLRRGAAGNGWGCTTITREGSKMDLEEILRGETRVVVFEESNENAAARIREIRRLENEKGERMLGDVTHVNCGFLPSSERSWESAWAILSKEQDAWMHLHENVGVEEVQSRRVEIETRIRGWVTRDGAPLTVEVEHVELVKTFAPGVWHCVFDIHVAPSPATAPNSRLETRHVL